MGEKIPNDYHNHDKARRRIVRPLLLVCLLLSVATPAFAVLGDLDLDSDVDFDDFFLFVDNFGKTGPPDTLRVVVRDTLVVELVDTLKRVVIRQLRTLGIVGFPIPRYDAQIGTWQTQKTSASG